MTSRHAEVKLFILRNADTLLTLFVVFFVAAMFVLSR